MSSKLGHNVSKDEFDDMYNAMYCVYSRVVDFNEALHKNTIDNFDTEFDHFVKCVISYCMDRDVVDTYTLSFMKRWWGVYHEAQNKGEADRFESLYKALLYVARRYIDLTTPRCVVVQVVLFNFYY